MDLKTWLRANWDRALGAVGTAVGLLAVLLGYLGVKDTPFPAEQVPYVVSGAVLGIALIGIGLTSWLSADLRDEWHKLDRIEQLLEGQARDDGAGGAGEAQAPVAAPTDVVEPEPAAPGAPVNGTPNGADGTVEAPRRLGRRRGLVASGRVP